jgi:hypothetical protein
MLKGKIAFRNSLQNILTILARLPDTVGWPSSAAVRYFNDPPWGSEGHKVIEEKDL